MTSVSHKESLKHFRWPEKNVGCYGLTSDIAHETSHCYVVSIQKDPWSNKQFSYSISKTCFLTEGIHWLSGISLPQADHNCYFTPEPMSQRLTVWTHINIKQRHAALCLNYNHSELWLNDVWTALLVFQCSSTCNEWLEMLCYIKRINDILPLNVSRVWASSILHAS